MTSCGTCRTCPTDVAVARDAVFAALDQAVLSQVTRQATQQATGLNVFFPTYTQFAADLPRQRTSVRPAGASSSRRTSTPRAAPSTTTTRARSFVSEQAQIVQQGPDGILIAGQLGDGQADNVTSTETQVFTAIGGQQALIDRAPGVPQRRRRSGRCRASWSYQVTAVSNGDGPPVPVSSIYQGQSGGLIGTFYARYQPAAGDLVDVQFRVLLGADGSIEGVTVAQAGDGGSAAITLDGGTLTPYYIVQDQNGFSLSPSSQSVPVSADFRISFPRLPRGTTFDMGVVVGDVSGNYDGAFATAQVQGGGGQGGGQLRVQ